MTAQACACRCPPCRQFTPALASVYNKLKRKGEKFEIIFVSSDRSASDQEVRCYCVVVEH